MGVCVVENLSRVFLSEYLVLHLWVMRVYVWVKGREVTLKKFSKQKVSREDLTREILAKMTAWPDFSASSHVLLTCPFHGNSSRELVAKCNDLHLSLSLHQLNI